MTDGTRLNNPTDPLRKVEDAGQELFKRMGRTCDGFSSDAVIAAASNIVLNAIRQAYGQRYQAEARYDELTARLKGLLMDHYDPVTGKRRNIFPHTQELHVPFLHDVDRIN